MHDISKNLRLTIEGLAHEIADRCNEDEPIGHAQIERHARTVLIDYFLGKFNPMIGYWPDGKTNKL